MSTVQTAADVIRSEFNFNVVKLPLSGPEGLSTPLYGLFRDDRTTGALVNDASVSARYVPHTTDDVIALTDAAAEAFGDLEVNCHFNKGHFVDVRPSNEQRRQLADGSGIWPRIMISAGYNGKSFKATMGFFRDACSNLAMIRRVRTACVSIRHNGNLRAHMEELIGNFQALRQGWTDMNTLIDHWSAAPVSVANFFTHKDILGEIPESAGRRRTEWENTFEAVMRRLQRERANLGRPRIDENPDTQLTAWELFNGWQGYIQHEATMHGRPDSATRLFKAYNSPKVAKAENVLAGLIAA
jgi:hypothetical protein